MIEDAAPLADALHAEYGVKARKLVAGEAARTGEAAAGA